MVWADNCVLQDRTVTQGSVVIQERSKIEVEVFALTNGLKRCQVTFRARVGAEWRAWLAVCLRETIRFGPEPEVRSLFPLCK